MKRFKLFPLRSEVKAEFGQGSVRGLSPESMFPQVKFSQEVGSEVITPSIHPPRAAIGTHGSRTVGSYGMSIFSSRTRNKLFREEEHRMAHADSPGEGLESSVQGSGFRVQSSGFRVQGSRSRVHGSGFRVQGLGGRVKGAGSRVQGSGFR